MKLYEPIAPTRHGAFAARSYPPDAAGRVMLRVEDPLCPWNSGTWSLEIDGGQGQFGRAGGGRDRTADTAATTTIRGLAALFTGFSGPDELARVGLLDGVDSTGLRVLRAASASPKPFTAELYWAARAGEGSHRPRAAPA